MAYVILTIVLVLVCIGGILIWKWGNMKKRPSYYGKMPTQPYDKAFLISVRKVYEVTGDVKSMLMILKGNYPNGKEAIRIKAAMDYLSLSRYKDYETALYYLSDHTEECEEVIQDILEQEVKKKNCLLGCSNE